MPNIARGKRLLGRLIRSAAVGPNRNKILCVLHAFQSFNTERTVHLRELCVEAFGHRGHRAATDTSRNLRASRRRRRLVRHSCSAAVLTAPLAAMGTSPLQRMSPDLVP